MAHVLCAFILVLCLAFPAVAGKKRSLRKKESSPKKRFPAAENPLVNEMLRHLGVQYRRGGSSPRGVDCSGYVGLVYRNAYGVTLPHQSASLYRSSDLQEVPLDELQTGDLLFFTASRKSRRISHVGIYLSEGRFVHSSIRKGVIVSSLDKQYYSERIAGARRVPDQPQSGDGEAGSLENRADLSMMSHPVGLELGRNRGFEISLFHDSLFPLKETDLEYSSHGGFMGVEEPAFSAHVQGISIGRDISPFTRLVVTPLLSHVDNTGDLNETGLPRRSVGLDISLGSKADAWRLSTGFRYPSLISTRGYAHEDRAPEGIDMSLRYSRRLSDGLSVSLIGERLQRYRAPALELTRQERIFDDERFSVIFNFSY